MRDVMSVQSRFAGMAVVAAIAAGSAIAGCAAAPSTTPEHLGIDRSADTALLGYCRTTTCPAPAGYPMDAACAPADWSSSDTCMKLGASGAPLWWRSSCVGYDLNAAASRGVDFIDFTDAVHAAFTAWTGATCHADDDVKAASSRVSVDARDLGPVACARATYDKTGPNQNVITFHDDRWPYEAADPAATGAAKSTTIALTTVTFDPESGEIFDADVEINSADYEVVPLSVVTAPTPDQVDLQAVLTHELGHFLGLAHSPSADAVMNASGDADIGSAVPKRDLRSEDVSGICAIYPPDLSRLVSTLVDPSGRIAAGACDPRPRRGLSSTCN
jgi:hypothetical protein